jgi:two-component system, NtrC family, response regulator HydG
MKATPSILVVDDEMDHCLNLADILTDLDYWVDIAPDGPTALELLSSKAYDAALLDLVMPGMDGLCLLRGIKERHPELPACFVTANMNGALAAEVRASGAGPMIGKPLDIPRLLYWVDGAVGRRKCTRDR